MSSDASWMSANEMSFQEASIDSYNQIKKNLAEDFDEFNETIKHIDSEAYANTQNFLRVFLRVRPYTEQELKTNSVACFELHDDGCLMSIPPRKKSTTHRQNQLQVQSSYYFSKIFDEDVNQKDFFDGTCCQMVQDFVNGKNGLVFTYGVTNAGKTYTLQGKLGEEGVLPRSIVNIFNTVGNNIIEKDSLYSLDDNDCIILLTKEEKKKILKKKNDILTLAEKDSELSCEFSFDSISSQQDSFSSSNTSKSSRRVSFIEFSNSKLNESLNLDKSNVDIKYMLLVSYVELYKEQVYDLLTPIKNHNRKILHIKENKHQQPYVKGASQIPVYSQSEVFKLLELGKKNLHFAATKINKTSSRSHAIFSIKCVRVENNTDGYISMISFCDLAGIERQNKTSTTGERLNEAKQINKSMMTLEKCIRVVRENQKNKSGNMVIPYRESKLTRLLQRYLNGDAQACMLVNISPSPITYDETSQILKFSAITASQIKLKTDSMMSRKSSIPKKKNSSFGKKAGNKLALQDIKENEELSSKDKSSNVVQIENKENQSMVSKSQYDAACNHIKKQAEFMEKMQVCYKKAKEDMYNQEVKLRNEFTAKMRKQYRDLTEFHNERRENEVKMIKTHDDQKMADYYELMKIEFEEKSDEIKKLKKQIKRMNGEQVSSSESESDSSDEGESDSSDEETDEANETVIVKKEVNETVVKKEEAEHEKSIEEECEEKQQNDDNKNNDMAELMKKLEELTVENEEGREIIQFQLQEIESAKIENEQLKLSLDQLGKQDKSIGDASAHCSICLIDHQKSKLLQIQVDSYEAQIKELENDLIKIKEENKSKDDDLDVKYDELQKKYEEKCSENESLHLQVQNKNDDFKIEVSDMEKQFEEKYNYSEKNKLQTEEELSSLKSKYLELEKVISDLREEKENAQLKDVEINAELKDLKIKFDEQCCEAESLKLQMKAKQSGLESENVEFQKVISDLRNEKKKVQLEDVESNAEFEDLKRKFNEQCCETDSFKLQMETKVSGLESENLEFQNVIKDLRNEKEKVQLKDVEINAELEELQVKLNEKCCEVKTLKSQMETKVSGLESENLEFQNVISDLRNEKEKVQLKDVEINAELEELQVKLNEKCCEVKTLKSQLKDEVCRLENQCDLNDEEIFKLRAESVKYSTDCDKLQQLKEKLDEQIAEASKEIISYQTKNDKLLFELEEKTNEVEEIKQSSELQKKLFNTENENALAEMRDNFEKLNGEHDQKIKKLENEIASANKLIVEKNEEISALSLQMENELNKTKEVYENVIKELQKDLTTKDERIATVISEAEERENVYLEEKNQLSRKSSENNNNQLVLESRILELHEKIEENNKKVQEELTKKEKENVNLEKQLSKKSECLTTMEKENEQLEKQLFKTKEQILDLQSTLKSKDLKDMQETDLLKNNVKEFEEGLKLKDNELESLNLKLSTMEKEKHQLENELSQSQSKVAEYQSENEQKEINNKKESDTLKNNIINLEENIEAKENKLRTLNSKIETLENIEEKIKDKLAANKKETTELKCKISQMQISHASEIEKIENESQDDFKKQINLVKSLQSENKQLKQRFENVKTELNERIGEVIKLKSENNQLQMEKSSNNQQKLEFQPLQKTKVNRKLDDTLDYESSHEVLESNNKTANITCASEYEMVEVMNMSTFAESAELYKVKQEEDVNKRAGASEYEMVEVMNMSTFAESAELYKVKQEEDVNKRAGASEYEMVEVMNMSTFAESAELTKVKQEGQLSDSEFDLKEMSESDESDFNPEEYEQKSRSKARSKKTKKTTAKKKKTRVKKASEESTANDEGSSAVDEVRDVSYKKPSIEVEVTSTKKKRGRKAKATKNQPEEESSASAKKKGNLFDQLKSSPVVMALKNAVGGSSEMSKTAKKNKRKTRRLVDETNPVLDELPGTPMKNSDEDFALPAPATSTRSRRLRNKKK